MRSKLPTPNLQAALSQGPWPEGTRLLTVRGARSHNLKNVSLSVPRDQLVVFTGVSGSGKSSLAFDTIFAEGQRRYVESLSAYARQFLGQMDKPDVDDIEGLSPAISIDQKSTSHNPRSTVGTVTEIYDHLRLLYARCGQPHCPKCDAPIEAQSVESIVDAIMAWPEGTRFQVMSPVVRSQKGHHMPAFEAAKKAGFVRARVNGEAVDLAEPPALDKAKKHDVAIVVDRLVLKPDLGTRLADSVATALKHANGLLLVERLGVKGDDSAPTGDVLFSEHHACAKCSISLEEIAPRLFSFNSPYGACPECHGLGATEAFDPAMVIPDVEKTLKQGAVAPWARTGNPYYMELLGAVAKGLGFNLDTPWNKLAPIQRDAILNGAGDRRFPINAPSWYAESGFGYESRFEGVLANLARRYRETTSDKVKEELQAFMSATPCTVCQGARLKPEALAVRLGGKSISQLTALAVRDARDFLLALELSPRHRLIANQVLKEVQARLGFLVDVGLDYLSLGRGANTLSGGEAQRIRLASQIGSGLQGVLYVLDEPSIGLHQRDNHRLLGTLKRLRDLGNTLIVVEHDEDTIRAADHLVDIGPKAGVHGGHIVVAGTVADIEACPESLTGAYLSGRKAIEVPSHRRPGSGKFLRLKGAKAHNLAGLDVDLPLGQFVAVTGVSGSGKSTLINHVMLKALQHQLSGNVPWPKGLESLEGVEHIDKVIVIDQAPIGRTPRSNPATYTGLFDHLRELYAATNEAKTRGYGPGRFSFNVKGGRCEACKGEGLNRIEMHFLPDVYVPCEQCKGARYNRETLAVTFRGKSIADALAMTIEEALDFFGNVPKAKNKLQTLHDVGLDYVQLGQPATTLSGGEAQRVKLAEQLARRATGKTLYVLDEPSTGLSFYDVHKLLEVLNRLVDSGNTVLVIEHNLDVIKQADHVVDLGPEGGDRGGQLVAQGPPELVAKVAGSFTGAYLAPLLARAAVGQA